MMFTVKNIVPFLLAAQAVVAHEGHGHDDKANAGASYAQRHMSSEHHIDSFDASSFHQIHDLNRDGVWDQGEIEAIYGVHHVYSQRKSKDDIEHQKKADHVVVEVLKIFDKDRDGKISLREFELVGVDALPSFEDIGAEGHHYDVESEFFLHHEEMYHSTPETQNDESYTHPEDIEHFAHHENIEREELLREAKFQGITYEEALEQHEPHDHDHDEAPAAPPSPPPIEEEKKANPKIVRQPPPEKQAPEEKFKNLQEEKTGQDEWGTGAAGYMPPKSPAEKFRKNLPYKYKFRRAWGDF